MACARNKSTSDLSLGGGRNYPHTSEDRTKYINCLAAWTGLSHERLETLFDRYGTRAEALAEFMKLSADAPLISLPNYSKREILFLAQYERVEHLDDLLLRRTMLAMLGKLSREAVLECAGILADAFGWSLERKNAEAERAHSPGKWRCHGST